jgi:hypothetical protein
MSIRIYFLSRIHNTSLTSAYFGLGNRECVQNICLLMSWAPSLIKLSDLFRVANRVLEVIPNMGGFHRAGCKKRMPNLTAV